MSSSGKLGCGRLVLGGLAVVCLIGYVKEHAGSASGVVGASIAPGCATAGYSGDQMTNASTIVAVGQQQGIPEQGWVVAIAAAMQESSLRNLDHGDRDSLGLFQERPSQGWGTPAQIMDPGYSATQFYQHLTGVPGWQGLPVTEAAQAVERSGYPDAYAQHEQAAREVVATVQNPACRVS